MREPTRMRTQAEDQAAQMEREKGDYRTPSPGVPLPASASGNCDTPGRGTHKARCGGVAGLVCPEELSDMLDPTGEEEAASTGQEERSSTEAGTSFGEGPSGIEEDKNKTESQEQT